MENANKKLIELEKYVGEHFLMADLGIVRLLCAVVIANRLPGDPVWLLIVAPPSGLKTELLNALDKVESIYQLSSLTPKTLASGQLRPGASASLLDELHDKVLTFKDFTTILEMNYNARDEILSQLREVYDGKFSKKYGNGAEVRWEGKLGFMAGVTDAVELYQGRINIIGERFVQYRMKQPDREAATKRGLENAARIVEIREELKTMCADLIDGTPIPSDVPHISKELEGEIIELSNFATLARAGIVRDSKDRDITNVFPAEMPVRFAKQLIQISKAFLIMGAFGDTEKAILRRIAMSSVFRNRRRALSILMKRRCDVDLTGKDGVDKVETDDFGFEEPNEETGDGDVWITKDVALALDLPSTSTRRILEELTALGLIKRIGKARGNTDGWELLPKYKTLLDNHFSDYEAE